MKVSSTALDSYGSLLFNAASLAIIRAVLAMIQHERSASKTKIFGLRNFSESEKNRDFLENLIFSKNQKNENFVVLPADDFTRATTGSANLSMGTVKQQSSGRSAPQAQLGDNLTDIDMVLETSIRPLQS